VLAGAEAEESVATESEQASAEQGEAVELRGRGGARRAADEGVGRDLK
jgi:hypothetical protein